MAILWLGAYSKSWANADQKRWPLVRLQLKARIGKPGSLHYTCASTIIPHNLGKVCFSAIYQVLN